MYCNECGSFIPEGTSTCPVCGAPVNSVPTPVQVQTQNPSPNLDQFRVCPKTHLTKAILLTIFCCWPFGIPAIVNAAGVENAFSAGNYNAALDKSQKAAKWCNITLIVGIVFWILYILFFVVMIIIAINEGGGIEDVLDEFLDI